MTIERTNLQLSADADGLTIFTASDNARSGIIETKGLRRVDLNKAGLKDASGASNDYFTEDTSLYVKLGNSWAYTDVSPN